MDAVKFIKELRRMCNVHGNCGSCPAHDCECDSLENMVKDTRIVAIVEEWSTAHRCKTRQDVFLEHWPDATLDRRGVSVLCPKQLNCEFSCIDENDTETPKRCKDCTACRREFWMQEVK